MCLSTYTVLFFPNKHYLLHCCLSLLGNSFLHNWWARAFSLVSGGLVARIQHPHFLSHTEALPFFFFFFPRKKPNTIDNIFFQKLINLRQIIKWKHTTIYSKRTVYFCLYSKRTVYILFLLKTHKERSDIFVYSTHEDVFCECGLKQRVGMG